MTIFLQLIKPYIIAKIQAARDASSTADKSLLAGWGRDIEVSANKRKSADFHWPMIEDLEKPYQQLKKSFTNCSQAIDKLKKTPDQGNYEELGTLILATQAEIERLKIVMSERSYVQLRGELENCNRAATNFFKTKNENFYGELKTAIKECASVCDGVIDWLKTATDEDLYGCMRAIIVSCDNEADAARKSGGITDKGDFGQAMIEINTQVEEFFILLSAAQLLDRPYDRQPFHIVCYHAASYFAKKAFQDREPISQEPVKGSPPKNSASFFSRSLDSLRSVVSSTLGYHVPLTAEKKNLIIGFITDCLAHLKSLQITLANNSSPTAYLVQASELQGATKTSCLLASSEYILSKIKALIAENKQLCDGYGVGKTISFAVSSVANINVGTDSLRPSNGLLELSMLAAENELVALNKGLKERLQRERQEEMMEQESLKQKLAAAGRGEKVSFTPAEETKLRIERTLLEEQLAKVSVVLGSSSAPVGSEELSSAPLVAPKLEELPRAQEPGAENGLPTAPVEAPKPASAKAQPGHFKPNKKAGQSQASSSNSSFAPS